MLCEAESRQSYNIVSCQGKNEVPSVPSKMKKLAVTYPNARDTHLERIDESVFDDPAALKQTKVWLQKRKVGVDNLWTNLQLFIIRGGNNFPSGLPIKNT